MFRSRKAAFVLAGFGLFLSACGPAATAAAVSNQGTVSDSAKASQLCATYQPGVTVQLLAAFDSTVAKVVRFEEVQTPGRQTAWAGRPPGAYLAVCYFQTNTEFPFPHPAPPPGQAAPPPINAVCMVIAPDGTEQIDRASTRANMQLLRP